MREKYFAWVSDLKLPDTFCLALIILRSRSDWLLSKSTMAQKHKQKIVVLDPGNRMVDSDRTRTINLRVMNPKGSHGKEVILEQFRSRLLTLTDSLNIMGKKPIIVNCYVQGLFTDIDYGYTKKMNQVINTCEYPSVNVLGTIDNGKGNWLTDYFHDSRYLNDLGHEEITYAFVPFFFEAIEHGKGTPHYDWKHNYISLKKIKQPVRFNFKLKIKSIHNKPMIYD